MATLTLIFGLGIVGLVIAQTALATRASFATLLREREVRFLSKQLWLERVELANSLRQRDALWQAAWNGYRKFVVDRRVVEADGICSFYLVPHDNKHLPEFKPGQYLTFQIECPGQPKPLVRCYSLSSAPDEKHYRVTIKRVPAPRDVAEAPPGLISNHFHDHVTEGAILDVKAPSGNFVLDLSDQRPVVLIGGGVGITPLLSMIDTVGRLPSEREVWLFNGVRNGREHAMREHLRDLAHRRDMMHVVTCYSAPREDEVKGRDFDESGHLNVDVLRKYLRDREGLPTNNYVFYICGPPPMMKTLLPQLQAWGVPKHDIHTEAFGPASIKARAKPPAPPVDKPAATKIQITFARTAKQLTWDAQSSNLLELAEENGIEINSGCRTGSCGTCKVAVKSGQVVYDAEPECDIEDGCCLTCVGRPHGDVVLDA